MKTIIYTITNSSFCTQVKDYLTAKNIPYEEKNIETNKDFLAEMLTASDNFAGVPYTWFQFDDGTEAGLKGFTEREFDDLLAHHQLISDQSIPTSIPQSNPTIPQDAPMGIDTDDKPAVIPQDETVAPAEVVGSDVDNESITDDNMATDAHSDTVHSSGISEPLGQTAPSPNTDDIEDLKTEEVIPQPLGTTVQPENTSTPISQHEPLDHNDTLDTSNQSPEPMQSNEQQASSQGDTTAQSTQLHDILDNLKQQGVGTTQQPQHEGMSNPLDGKDTTNAINDVRQKMSDLQEKPEISVDTDPSSQSSNIASEDAPKIPDFPK